MSRAEAGEPGAVTRTIRTVTPPYRGRPDAEMTAVGLAYALALLVLLVPLLPFVLVVWVLSKLLGVVGRARGSE